MRFGLDVGDKRIGVALSDGLGLFAHPSCSIERDNDSACLKNLSSLIESNSNVNQSVEIVIGLPLELSGIEGKQAQKVKAFAKTMETFLQHELKSHHISVVFWDERLSSVEADRALVGSKLKNKSRRKALDQISAVIILQSYLDSKTRPHTTSF